MFAVDVLLKPAGNAPILKKKKWTVDRHKQIGWICEFIRKFIRTETEDSVVRTHVFFSSLLSHQELMPMIHAETKDPLVSTCIHYNVFFFPVMRSSGSCKIITVFIHGMRVHSAPTLL